MWVTLPAFGAAAYLPSIVLERALFVRERNDGLYRVITYLLAKAVDELLLALLTSLGVAAFVFYGVGFTGEFPLFWLTYYATLCFGIMLAYFVAAIAPNMDAANAILPTYVTALLFFGGLIINFQDMPVWWKWFSYIDPIKYGWGALMVNQFSETNPVYNGVPVLSFFGFQDTNKWQYLGILSVFFFVFFLLALVVLSVRKFSSR
jgi:ATP-binding cassette subfamily G (WHITE) protein 2